MLNCSNDLDFEMFILTNLVSMYFVHDALGVNRLCIGNLLRISTLYPVPLEEAIANYKVLTPEQIVPVASFIRACIRLDPAEQASAEELQVHDWLGSAFVC
jgi:hypothetical protein